jgi:glutaredoxin/glutathione-dependent peroxiredoxin
MTIQIGDPIPNATFTVMAPDGPQLRTTDQIFKGRKVVLFGVAGAFTPLCDKHHLPGFLDNLDQFKAQGVDEIAVTGVNDVFVMEAWAKSAGADGKISFLADGNGGFARALGLSLDLTTRAGSCDDCPRWRGTKAQPRSGAGQGRNVKRGNPAEATLDPLALTAGYGAPSPLRRVLRAATMLPRRMRRATNPLQQIGRRLRFPYS